MGFYADRKLKKIPVQGGAPMTLSDWPFALGASWGDDDNIIMALNGGSAGLARIPSGGGAPTRVTELIKEKGETAHVWPQVLPGGRQTADIYPDKRWAFRDLDCAARKRPRPSAARKG